MMGRAILYNSRSEMAHSLVHKHDPLSPAEWDRLTKVVRAVGSSTVARRVVPMTGPLGAGVQTVPAETAIGITEGSVGILGAGTSQAPSGSRSSGIVPLIFKDFVIHWRDLEESRLTGNGPPLAKSAAAASACALSEDRFLLYGDRGLGYSGLMTAGGRQVMKGLAWGAPGEAFSNFARITERLMSKGHTGPHAAVVHPKIYSDMHRVVKGSNLLEISHVRSLFAAGIFRSSLLESGTGFVISTRRENVELIIAIDTSVAFLGARRMNLPFRVLKAVYLRILRGDAICSFET